MDMLDDKPHKIEGPKGDSIELRTVNVTAIPAATGYMLLGACSGDGPVQLWQMPIIAWQVETVERVARNRAKNGRIYVQKDYISHVTAVTPEGDETGFAGDLAIELPTGQIEMIHVQSFDNRAELRTYFETQRGEKFGPILDQSGSKR